MTFKEEKRAIGQLRVCCLEVIGCASQGKVKLPADGLTMCRAQVGSMARRVSRLHMQRIEVNP